MFPDSFCKEPSTDVIYDDKELYLLESGEALQNNPIEPMLRPSRGVNVLIVNNNSANSDDDFPTSTALFEKTIH